MGSTTAPGPGNLVFNHPRLPPGPILRSPGELDGNETQGVIYGAFELPLSVGIVESLLLS